MYITDNIRAQEVLPKEIWEQEGLAGLRLMDDRIIQANQKIRTRQGRPRFFNTWDMDKPYLRNESGLRIPTHEHYSVFSQHSYGRGLDSISETIPHEELWDDILKRPKLYFDFGITVIESINLAPTWLHSDCRSFIHGNKRIDELLIVDKVDGIWSMFTIPQWIKKST